MTLPHRYFACHRYCLITVLGIVIGILSSPISAQEAAKSPTTVKKAAKFQLPEETTATVVVPGEKLILTGQRDGRIRAWTKTGEEKSPPLKKVDAAVTAMAISEDGLRLVISDKSPKITVIERESGKSLATFIPPSVVELLSVSGATIGAKSQAIQIFDTTFKRETFRGPTDPSVNTIVVLPQSRVLAHYAAKDGALSGIPLPLPYRGDPIPARFHPQNLLRPNQKLLDLSFSNNGRVAVALYEKSTLVPLTWSRYRPQLDVVLPQIKIERVITSQFGSCVACLGTDTDTGVGRCLIWDLVSDRPFAELAEFPANAKSAGIDPKDGLFFAIDRKGMASTWELPPLKERPASLLRGKVSFHQWEENHDPDFPLKLNGWTAERIKDADMPAFMKGALKLTPPKQWNGTFFPNVEKEGRFFAVMTLSRDADAKTRLRQVLAHHMLVRGEFWDDWGPCPWKPDANLYGVVRNPENNDIYGLDLEFLRDELYFAPGVPQMSPEEFGKLPASLRYQTLRNQIHSWLIQRNYKEIENFANTLRQSKDTIRWGYPSIGAVYEAFTVSPTLSKESLEQRITEYAGKEKGSVTAMVAAARWYSTRGSEERGSDVGANVSEKQGRAFASYLSTARQLLKTVEGKAGDDPYWDAAYLGTLFSGRIDPEEVISITLRGLKKNPRCLAPVEQATILLLPRWSGTADSASRLAERIRQEIPGEDGQALAAALATRVYWFEPDQWNDGFGFDRAQFEKDAAVLRKKMDDNSFLSVFNLQISLALGKPEDRPKLWRELGTRFNVNQFGGFAAFAELNDRMEQTPRSELVWSSLERSQGRIAISPDGKNLLKANESGRVRFLSTTDGSLVGDQQGPFLSPKCVLLPRADHALIVFETGWVHYDNQSGVKLFPLPKQVVFYDVRVSADGRRMVLISEDGAIQFVDLTTGKLLAELPKGVDFEKLLHVGLALSGDGSTAAITTAANQVTLFDTKTGKKRGQLLSKVGTVVTLQFLADDSRLAGMSDTHAVEWKLVDKSEVWSTKIGAGGTLRLVVSENGRYWAALTNHPTLDADAGLYVLDRKRSPEKWRSVPEIRTRSSFVWHPTEPRLFVSSFSGILTAWDVDKLPDGAVIRDDKKIVEPIPVEKTTMPGKTPSPPNNATSNAADILTKAAKSVNKDSSGQIIAIDFTEVTLNESHRAALASTLSLRKFTAPKSGLVDSDLKILGGLKQLDSLGIWQTKVTDQGFEHLSGLDQLSYLSVEGNAGVTDKGLSHLTKLKKLSWLGIGYTGVTDDGMSEVAKIPSLSRLDAANTNITDRGLAELGKLRTLKTITLTRTKVTDAGIAKLKMSLPECQVVR